jgi:hypothetical protein
MWSGKIYRRFRGACCLHHQGEDFFISCVYPFSQACNSVSSNIFSMTVSPTTQNMKLPSIVMLYVKQNHMRFVNLWLQTVTGKSAFRLWFILLSLLFFSNTFMFVLLIIT